MFISGLLIAAGHFILLVPGLAFFWCGLLVIAAGTGLLKPNISTVLGVLYAEGDPRRDGGLSLFYFGINVGAFTAPLICGWVVIIAVPGFRAQDGHSSSATWILATFLVLTWAELLTVPIAPSTTTELEPPHLTSQLLGVWYLAAAAGGAIGGQVARLVEALGFGNYFVASGLVVILVGGVCFALRPLWSRLLAPIR